MSSSMDAVKELRAKTGAGILDCKKALDECEGDIAKSVEFLRKKGLAEVEKRSGRQASEGLIGHYVHLNGKIGVLVEVNCETDFVARNDEFKAFVKDVCMQVAATDPISVRREDVPPEVVEQEKRIYAEQFKNKPPQVVEKIVNGKLDKFFEERCLLEQKFIKDDSVTIGDLLKSLSAKVGEKMEIRRFVRFEVGGD